MVRQEEEEYGEGGGREVDEELLSFGCFCFSRRERGVS